MTEEVPKLGGDNDQKLQLTIKGAERLEEWKNAFRALPGFVKEYKVGDRESNEIFAVSINLGFDQERDHTIWVALMDDMTAEISPTCECEEDCPAGQEIFNEVSGTWLEIYTLVLNFLYEKYNQIPQSPPPAKTANA
jgi:hypothetical protein